MLGNLLKLEQLNVLSYYLHLLNNSKRDKNLTYYYFLFPKPESDLVR